MSRLDMFDNFRPDSKGISTQESQHLIRQEEEIRMEQEKNDPIPIPEFIDSVAVNISNHQSSKWSKEQLSACNYPASQIRDISFPNVPPNATKKEINELAHCILQDVLNLKFNSPTKVMIQGEFTLTFHLVNLLKSHGYIPVAACSERDVTEIEGKKIVRFKFIQFREY